MAPSRALEAMQIYGFQARVLVEVLNTLVFCYVSYPSKLYPLGATLHDYSEGAS